MVRKGNNRSVMVCRRVRGLRKGSKRGRGIKGGCSRNRGSRLKDRGSVKVYIASINF